MRWQRHKIPIGELEWVESAFYKCLGWRHINVIEFWCSDTPKKLSMDPKHLLIRRFMNHSFICPLLWAWYGLVVVCVMQFGFLKFLGLITAELWSNITNYDIWDHALWDIRFKFGKFWLLVIIGSIGLTAWYLAQVAQALTWFFIFFPYRSKKFVSCSIFGLHNTLMSNM